MSKIHFLQNKDVFIAVAVAVGLFFLTVYNLGALVPVIVSSSFNQAPTVNTAPIDKDTVNQAIDLLQAAQ